MNGLNDDLMSIASGQASAEVNRIQQSWLQQQRNQFQADPYTYSEDLGYKRLSESRPEMFERLAMDPEFENSPEFKEALRGEIVAAQRHYGGAGFATRVMPATASRQLKRQLKGYDNEGNIDQNERYNAVSTLIQEFPDHDMRQKAFAEVGLSPQLASVASTLVEYDGDLTLSIFDANEDLKALDLTRDRDELRVESGRFSTAYDALLTDERFMGLFGFDQKSGAGQARIDQSIRAVALGLSRAGEDATERFLENLEKKYERVQVGAGPGVGYTERYSRADILVRKDDPRSLTVEEVEQLRAHGDNSAWASVVYHQFGFMDEKTMQGNLKGLLDLEAGAIAPPDLVQSLQNTAFIENIVHLGGGKFNVKLFTPTETGTKSAVREMTYEELEATVRERMEERFEYLRDNVQIQSDGDDLLFIVQREGRPPRVLSAASHDRVKKLVAPHIQPGIFGQIATALSTGAKLGAQRLEEPVGKAMDIAGAELYDRYKIIWQPDYNPLHRTLTATGELMLRGAREAWEQLFDNSIKRPQTPTERFIDDE